MRRRSDVANEVELRKFRYRSSQFESWVSAHERWWPQCRDASVWGPFAGQAACGRYTFSGVNQAHRHFAETLVAWHLECEGYVCWTGTRILRKPGRALHGLRAKQTRAVESLIRETIGLVPQLEYEKRYVPDGLRLKNPDLVGFHFGHSHWVFAEVKKDRDPLHTEQRAALLFLRELFPNDLADVFVASVLAQGTALTRPRGKAG